MENSAAALNVLNVEDDPDIQVIARIALEDIGGFEVLACNSADQAIAALGDFKPNLLLLDVKMPRMDGPTLMGRLHG